jgi:plasmid stability protein
MAQLLVRDLETDIINRLKLRAKNHHRSLQGEAKLILQEAAQRRTMEEVRERASRIRASFGKRKFSDSAELIREDRER